MFRLLPAETRRWNIALALAPRKTIDVKIIEDEVYSLVATQKCCDRGDTGLIIGTQGNSDMLIRSGRVPETSGMREAQI